MGRAVAAIASLQSQQIVALLYRPPRTLLRALAASGCGEAVCGIKHTRGGAGSMRDGFTASLAVSSSPEQGPCAGVSAALHSGSLMDQ